MRRSAYLLPQVPIAVDFGVQVDVHRVLLDISRFLFYKASLLKLAVVLPYCYIYSQEVRYVTRYLINPQFEDCPDKHVVCCKGYYKINGNCLRKLKIDGDIEKNSL